ncbi:MAG: NAD-dependent epimerase/dehydratase family protein [Anaerolineae bacterium]|nr:NAD-dependent epimerase/dehydratase family protein [Anaerolineae bacterium]
MLTLITGATGHIGNTLVRTLLSEHPEMQVRALLLPGDPASALQGLPIEIVRGDVLDPASLRAALQNVDTVFHLAGVIVIRPSARALVERVNIHGAVNVGQAALAAGVRRMVHVGSIHIFERLPRGTIDECVPLVTRQNAVGLYDYTKAEAVRQLQALVAEGLDVVFACPTGVFGPNDYLGSEYGAVLRGYLTHGTQVILNGGYNWVDVRDVARGLILAAQQGAPGELYLLGGHYCSMRDFLKLTENVLGRRYRAILLPYPVAWVLAQGLGLAARAFNIAPALTPYSLRTIRDNPNISHQKASAALGYAPRPLTETLRDALTWYAENPA